MANDELNSPVGPPSRVVHIHNLPPKCGWEELEEFLEGYPIDAHHLFKDQALVQFTNPQDAKQFLEQTGGTIQIQGMDTHAQLSNFPVLNLSSEFLASIRSTPSRVICIQLIHLRVYFSLPDVYDQCSKYGTVEKIICFKNNTNNVLVQMSALEEAAITLTNLHNNPRHLPNYQMHVQYSKNQEVVVKSNSSKSFNFLLPNSWQQFLEIRKSEQPFFEPEPTQHVLPLFNEWGPVHFDPAYSQVLCVTNLDQMSSAPGPLRNLFQQYGHVVRVKVLHKNRRTAFVKMQTSFFARIAMMMLNDCPFCGRKLQIAFSTHTEVTQSVEPGSDHLFKDYGNGPNDLGLDQYAAMSYPTEFVKVRGIRVSSLKTQKSMLPPEVKVISEINVLQFPNIQDAVSFIAAWNGIDFGGTRADPQTMHVAFTRYRKT